MTDTREQPADLPRDGATEARTRMPLLTLITQQAIDEDYLLAAEKLAAGAPRAPRGRPQRTAAVVVGVFGLLVATAFVQTRQNADVDDASRTTLISRVESQRDRLARQQTRVASLRERNSTLETSSGKLADSLQAALVRNRRLQVRTGFVAVVGEGIRITVTDRPDADSNQEIKDSDLQLLVNGLWEAGAEAVSVNNQRITALSAVRRSGDAIRVNNVGIAGPFIVEAIGDQRTLSARLFDTTTALAFVDLSDRFGFNYEVTNADELRLPSAPLGGLALRSAVTDPGTPGDDAGDGAGAPKRNKKRDNPGSGR